MKSSVSVGGQSSQNVESQSTDQDDDVLYTEGKSRVGVSGSEEFECDYVDVENGSMPQAHSGTPAVEQRPAPANNGIISKQKKTIKIQWVLILLLLIALGAVTGLFLTKKPEEEKDTSHSEPAVVQAAVSLDVDVSDKDMTKGSDDYEELKTEIESQLTNELAANNPGVKISVTQMKPGTSGVKRAFSGLHVEFDMILPPPMKCNSRSLSKEMKKVEAEALNQIRKSTTITVGGKVAVVSGMTSQGKVVTAPTEKHLAAPSEKPLPKCAPLNVNHAQIVAQTSSCVASSQATCAGGYEFADRSTTKVFVCLPNANLTSAEWTPAPEDCIRPAVETCTTHVCTLQAAAILSDRDTSVHPCVDFYKYSCGGYRKKNTLPFGPKISSYLDTMGKLRSETSHLIADMLNKPVKAGDPEATKNIKKYYQACMKGGAEEPQGPMFQNIEQNVTALKNMLKEFGGWPMIMGKKGTQQWDPTNFNLTRAMIAARAYGAGPVINFKVAKGTTTYDQHVFKMTLEMSDFPVFARFYDPAAEIEYNNFMVMLAMKLGNITKDDYDNSTNTLIKEDIEKDLEESKLFMTTMFMDSNTEPPFVSNTTLGDIYSNQKIKDLPIDLKSYITSITSAVDDADTIITNLPDQYFEKLKVTLSNNEILEETNVLANYIIETVITNIYLSKPNTDPRFGFGFANTMFRPLQPRGLMCADTAANIMPVEVSRQLVVNTSSLETYAEITAMIRFEIEAAGDMIDNTDWMDDQTKKKAHEKRTFITSFTGFPAKYMNTSLIDEIYRDYTFVSDHTMNQIIVAKTRSIANFRTIGMTGRELLVKASLANAFTINAFYSAISNLVAMPAGLLKAPFVRVSGTKAANYGKIGWAIGHEIFHGFDNRGSLYDKDGKLNNWWSNSSKSRFETRQKCLVDQYSKYDAGLDDGFTAVRGDFTLGENIADNGGLQAAFRGYRLALKKQGHADLKLPSLNLTSDQLFFMAAGQVWCSMASNAGWAHQYEFDNHAQGRARIIGSMSNSRYFAEAFNCPEGSPMNPKDKCEMFGNVHEPADILYKGR